MCGRGLLQARRIIHNHAPEAPTLGSELLNSAHVAGLEGRRLLPAQSAAVGLAIAFLVVLFRPDLVGTAQPASSRARRELRGRGVRQRAAAVATIYTERTFRRRTRRRASRLRGRALGSGVVIDPGAATSSRIDHVIRGADEIRVQLADGRVRTPRIVGTDPDSELALLKSTCQTCRRSHSAAPTASKSGDVVLAIGNPLGLSQTVTMGIVSATGRGSSASRSSRTSSRPTPRSTSATRAARWSTRAASSSASTRP